MSNSDMLDAALAWAEQGYHVFPCTPGAKTPACAHGVDDATTDPDRIRQWWTDNPEANIAVAPARSGCFVLDVDPPLGAETLARLELESGLLPRTLTFRTPRGGFHYWFKGDCPSTVNKLGPKLDTRGRGGYVLVPPSIVGGKPYERYCFEPIAESPAWICEAVGHNAERQLSTNADIDIPANVDRARALCDHYVRVNDVAVQGAGGDDRTYRLACEVLNLGLSPAKAWEVIRDHWNDHCSPPWDEDDLAQKVANAAEYAQNEAGSWAVAPAAELYAHVVASLRLEEQSQSRFRPIPAHEVEAFAEPTWIIPQLIPANGTVQITGKQKSFKTFLALDMALGIAAGVSTFGHIPQRSPVVYVAGENASAIALKHVPAWLLAHDATDKLSELPFYVVPNMPRAAESAEIAELVEQIKGFPIQPGVVVIDTATRALRGLDENSAKDMGVFSAACEYIQRELGCTVIVIRHTGKDTTRGGRGSNVIEGDFDTVLDVERHEKSMFVTLAVKEQRNAAEREEPFAFEGHLVGPSLVFQEITAEAYRKATRPEDVYAPARIGAALRGLNAVGEDKAVTTSVLAVELVPQIQGESPDDRQRSLARAEKALKTLARGRLEAYVSGAGAGLRWFLPS